MLRFTIFGIPVVVEPWFWLVMALLGGGVTALQRSYPADYLCVVLFMMAGFISVLVHELGHALTGWKRGGGQVWIRLWAMGGLAYQQGGAAPRLDYQAVVITKSQPAARVYGAAAAVDESDSNKGEAKR